MNNKNIKADKMRYQKNSSAYGLILLGMAISVHVLFSIITPKTVVPSITTAAEILLNIVLLLVTFLAAEKCKAYDKKWGMYIFIVAAIHVLRIFFEPSSLLRKGQITGFAFTLIAIELIATAALFVIAGYITIKKHDKLKAHLKELGE
ncbi:MAG: hypothetical protein RBQ91_01040 [Acholeplasma sp.]|nr:hypothetical protein [Acholeplasma sp.]